ncbi:MAG: hypothetical protein K2G73_07230 [Eubacterium sp.]|nr:hypothetical protein [Eubacterium sp.]
MIKKISSVSVLLLLIIIVACVFYMFVLNHNLTTELIDEIFVSDLDDFENEPQYFFIKDSKYNGFYDGAEKLKYLYPCYEFNKLNLDKFTYVVSINGTIESIVYNGRNCKRRTQLGFPDVYTAIVNYSKTNDNIIRIYKIKKINIDYNYHL